MIPQSNSWQRSVPCSSRESSEMKGMWFNQSWDVAISPSSRAIWQLSVEHTLGFLPELVPPAGRLVSLSLHTWPQPATGICCPPLLKLNPCVGLKGRRRSVLPWSQPLQAVVLYRRKVHNATYSYGRDGAGLQSTGVSWACVPFCYQWSLICYDRQIPACTHPLLHIFWHFEPFSHWIPLNPTRFRRKDVTSRGGVAVLLEDLRQCERMERFAFFFKIFICAHTHG